MGFEGKYEVSNKGNVDSLNYHRERRRYRMKLWDDRYGYKFVILYKNGVPYKRTIHRLVAMAFIPNPNNLEQVNHKDENKCNNLVENLEWCDLYYNLHYGTRIERYSKKKYKHIIQKDRHGRIIAEYNSMKEAEAKTGLRYENISKVCRGVRNFCGGFIWEYKDEETMNRARRKKKEVL